MKLYTRNELKDARIFFDKQPPRYMTVFIIFLILLLIVSVISAHFIKRPYIVKAQGKVSIDGTSFISTKTQGVITDIYAVSGQYVEAGQGILELSSGNEGLQKSVVESQIRELEETLSVMDKYEQAIEQKENILSQSGKELEYFGKVSYYLDILHREDFEINKIQKKITEKQSELNKLKQEMKSLETKVNYINDQIFSRDETNKNLNQSLIEKVSKKQDLLDDIAELEEKIALNHDNDELDQVLVEKQVRLEQIIGEIENKQSSLENDINQEQLMNEKSELESNLEMIKSKIEGFEEEINQLNEEVESPYSQAEQTRLQLISELGEKRSQIQNQLTELRANHEVATEQDTVLVVEASAAGVLHYLQPLSVGMSLQQNQIVGEIATDEGVFYVDAYIQAPDRSMVQEEQSVNVSIVGVNNYRFGTIIGTVEFIEPGTIQNETAEGVISFYRTKVSLNEELLTSKSGEVINLIRSMPVEVRIIYDEETYLEWFLNLLNLKSNLYYSQ